MAASISIVRSLLGRWSPGRLTGQDAEDTRAALTQRLDKFQENNITVIAAAISTSEEGRATGGRQPAGPGAAWLRCDAAELPLPPPLQPPLLTAAPAIARCAHSCLLSTLAPGLSSLPLALPPTALMVAQYPDKAFSQCLFSVPLTTAPPCLPAGAYSCDNVISDHPAVISVGAMDDREQVSPAGLAAPCLETLVQA